jgi:hypothetical protein
MQAISDAQSDETQVVITELVDQQHPFVQELADRLRIPPVIVVVSVS